MQKVYNLGAWILSQMRYAARRFGVLSEMRNEIRSVSNHCPFTLTCKYVYCLYGSET